MLRYLKENKGAVGVIIFFLVYAFCKEWMLSFLITAVVPLFFLGGAIWELYAVKKARTIEGSIVHFQTIEQHSNPIDPQPDYDPYDNFILTIQVVLEHGTTEFSDKVELDKTPVIGGKVKVSVIDGRCEIYRFDKQGEVIGNLIVAFVIAIFWIFISIWNSGYLDSYF